MHVVPSLIVDRGRGQNDKAWGDRFLRELLGFSGLVLLDEERSSCVVVVV